MLGNEVRAKRVVEGFRGKDRIAEISKNFPISFEIGAFMEYNFRNLLFLKWKLLKK